MMRFQIIFYVVYAAWGALVAWVLYKGWGLAGLWAFFIMIGTVILFFLGISWAAEESSQRTRLKRSLGMIITYLFVVATVLNWILTDVNTLGRTPGERLFVKFAAPLGGTIAAVVAAYIAADASDASSPAASILTGAIAAIIGSKWVITFAGPPMPASVFGVDTGPAAAWPISLGIMAGVGAGFFGAIIGVLFGVELGKKLGMGGTTAIVIFGMLGELLGDTLGGKLGRVFGVAVGCFVGFLIRKTPRVLANLARART